MNSKNNQRTYQLLILLLILTVGGSILFRLNSIQYNAELEQQRTAANHLRKFSEQTQLAKQIELKHTDKYELGAYIDIDPDQNFSNVVLFERLLGYELDHLLLFSAWGDEDGEFPEQKLKHISSLGISPIITWEPWARDFGNADLVQEDYSLSSIARGEHDTYIRDWARKARDFEGRIIIRFAHEMNTNPGVKSWYPWQGEPDNYVNAFKRVVDIFRLEQANNVEFMWNPIFFGANEEPEVYYPGNLYVDMIGVTVINLGNVTDTLGVTYSWLTCGYILQVQMESIELFNKPVYIAEMLTTDIGGGRAEWFGQCFEDFSKYPNIEGLNIYHANTASDRWTGEPLEWRITPFKDELAELIGLIDLYL